MGGRVGHAELVATLTMLPTAAGDELRMLPHAVRWLELRADLVGGIDPDLLAIIPPHQRLISWHGSTCSQSALGARFEKISTVEAKFYKLVIEAQQSGDELVPLTLLKTLGRSDTLAFASGKIGFWSRLLAPRLGCPLIFGTLDRSSADDGTPSVFQLIQDYGVPAQTPLNKLFGIVGNRVLQSPSPRLHNAAYRALGLPALFVPFYAESFADFWQNIVESDTLAGLGISVAGLTVASPYKEEPLPRARRSSPTATRADSSNVLVRTNGAWIADTTDSVGVMDALQERRISVWRRKAAVVGCGGSGRAIAAALVDAGAEVTLVNRGLERGERALRLLGLPFTPLSEFSVDRFDLVVNATPVGQNGEMPFGIERLGVGAVVIDLVYRDRPTPLVSETTSKRCIVVDGQTILRIQVGHQFRMMTGGEIPVGVFTRLLTAVRVAAA